MKTLLFIPFLLMCSMVIGQTSKIIEQSFKIIGTPIKLGKLEVAQNDFPKMMTWYEAKNACAILGEGWRLPTKDELDLLYQYKDEIGSFRQSLDNYYWSSTEKGGAAWGKNFGYDRRQSLDVGNYGFNDYVSNARAVRSF